MSAIGRALREAWGVGAYPCSQADERWVGCTGERSGQAGAAGGSRSDPAAPMPGGGAEQAAGDRGRASTEASAYEQVTRRAVDDLELGVSRIELKINGMLIGVFVGLVGEFVQAVTHR